MFGATQHTGAPAGYVTIETLVDMLGMSRQNLYQSGLHEAISSWKVGRGAILYREDDALQLQHYINTRKRLIEAGKLPSNHKLLDEGLWLDIFEGEHDE